MSHVYAVSTYFRLMNFVLRFLLVAFTYMCRETDCAMCTLLQEDPLH